MRPLADELSIDKTNQALSQVQGLGLNLPENHSLAVGGQNRTLDPEALKIHETNSLVEGIMGKKITDEGELVEGFQGEMMEADTQKTMIMQINNLGMALGQTLAKMRKENPELAKKVGPILKGRIVGDLRQVLSMLRGRK